jgi:hypothetical protein
MLDEYLFSFKNILKESEPVRFVNTYFGMPVNYSAKLLAIEGEHLSFQVSKAQIICMRRDRFTYLISSLLPIVLKARVVRLDLRNELAILTDFQRASNQIGNRLTVRVELNTPVHAVLIPENDKFSFRAQVTELSLNGAAVKLTKSVSTEKDFPKGSKIFIVFNLPVPISLAAKPVGQTVGTKGLVRHNVIHDDEFNRIGIQIFPTRDAEYHLSQYIAQRQTELLKELRYLSTQDLL